MRTNSFGNWLDCAYQWGRSGGLVLRGPAFSHQPERSSSPGIGCGQFAVSRELTSAFTRHQIGQSLSDDSRPTLHAVGEGPCGLGQIGAVFLPCGSEAGWSRPAQQRWWRQCLIRPPSRHRTLHHRCGKDQERSQGPKHWRSNQLRKFPERFPRMACSTKSSPNRLVNGLKPNRKR